MSDEGSQHVALLQQSVKYLSERLAALEKTQDKHAEEISESRGARSLASSLSGPVFAVMAMAITGLLYAGIQDNEKGLQEARIGLERKNQRIKAVWQELQHLQPVSVSKIKMELVDVNARLRANESTLKRRGGTINDMSSSIVTLKSMTQTHSAQIAEHEVEIDEMEDSVNSLESSVSSIKASAQAAFVEIETQLRGLTEVANLRMQEHWKYITLLWSKQRDEPLPEQEFHPTSIPATATSNVGKVTSNGSN